MVLECKYCKQTTTLDIIPTCCYPKKNKERMQEMCGGIITSIKQTQDYYTKKLVVTLSNKKEYSINYSRGDIFIECTTENEKKIENNGGNTSILIIVLIASILVNMLLLRVMNVM
jgi:hypothetical protein